MNRQTRDLAPGYTAEIDSIDESPWHELLGQFDDANLFQTWSCDAQRAGRHNISHLVLKANGDIAALAQVRLARLPVVGGIAYVRWGPVWQRSGVPHNTEIFRQACRALRNEYAVRRGLALRLFPFLFGNDAATIPPILAGEDFNWLGTERRDRTILIDLNRSLDDLRTGMRPHWRRQLKAATKEGLEIIEGTDDRLFEMFAGIHEDMVARKRFAHDDIQSFRSIQAALPDQFKMKIMLCKTGDNLCAGLVCSAIGKTAIYLLGATSSSGMKSRGSYLLHWKVMEWLKGNHVAAYDLNGIDPVANPGTYRFKNDLCGQNGQDVSFLGRFDSYPNILSRSCIASVDTVRTMYRALRNARPTDRRPTEAPAPPAAA